MTKDSRALLADRFLDEMVQGYRDGRHPDCPSPSANRSASYRHGFENGRDDHYGSPRALAQTLRNMADQAIAEDVEKTLRGSRPPDIEDKETTEGNDVMTFDEFKQGAGGSVFAALGDDGLWLDRLRGASDWSHLRTVVAAENIRRFASAVSSLASRCSRDELELLKAVCHLCDYSSLADELAGDSAWEQLACARGDVRRAIARCILNAA